MPRNRMIKPQFWDDSKIAKISRDARLLYIGMWNFCDDLGIIRADVVWLKSKIFPFDQIQIQQFEKICQEILRNGFISLFSYRNEKFYYLPKFSLHQKINKPNFEDVNVPKGILFKNLDKITEQSRINHGLITEQSIPKIEEEVEEENNNIPPIIPLIGDEEILQKQKELSDWEERLNTREQELIKREVAIKASEVKPPKIDFVADEFREIFNTWLEYKRQRKENYKSEKSLQSCYKQLLRLCDNNPNVATQIIEQSMANNWAGLFELKQRNNGNNRSSYTSKQEANAYALGLLQQHKRDLEEGLVDQMERPF